MLGNEEVMIERYSYFIKILFKYMEKYNKDNLDFAEIKTNYEVNNFIKTSKKYQHTKFIKNFPELFKNPKYRKYKRIISLNNFIPKLVYQDDKLIDAFDGTGSKNIINNTNFMKYIVEKKNEYQKTKAKKKLLSTSEKNINIKNKFKKINATKRTYANKDTNSKRKKAVIGRLVRLHFKFDTFNNIKGEIFQFGMRIANKNIKTLAQVKRCIDNLKANLNSYSYEEIQEVITLHPIKVLNQEMSSNSYIDVNLHTNSTTIKNGFWLYYFIIIKDNNDIVVSDPFSLISYKQLHKRKKNSFLEKHKNYMIKDKESLYPYYFKSMFFFDEDTKSYKLKKTFNFSINFYKKREPKENNKNSGNNKEMKKNIKTNYIHSYCSEAISNSYENYSGSEEVLKDLIPFDSVLGDIQLDNIS